MKKIFITKDELDKLKPNFLPIEFLKMGKNFVFINLSNFGSSGMTG